MKQDTGVAEKVEQLKIGLQVAVFQATSTNVTTLLTLCFNSKADLASWPGHVHGFNLYELSEAEEMQAGAGFCQIEVASGNDPEQGLFYCVTGVVVR